MENIKINFLHICENAFFDQDNKLCVIGIFDLIKAEKVPARHPSFFLVLNVSGRIADKDKEIEIESPSGEKIINSKVSPEKLEDKETTNLVINLVNMTFKEKGEYKIRFKVKGSQISPERNDILKIQ